MNKLVLEYEYDFELLGLVSSAKEYKLCWAINRCLGLSLSKQQDTRFDFSNEEYMLVSYFEETTEHWAIRLFKNKAVEFEKAKKPFLLPEKIEYDFFLQIEGEFEKCDLDEVKRKLTDLYLVQMINTVDTENLPSRENLIY